MSEHTRVDVIEIAVAHEPRFGAELLFRDPRPKHERSGNAFALHDLLQHDRSGYVDRLPGIVAFAVARRPLDDRVMISHAGFL